MRFFKAPQGVRMTTPISSTADEEPAVWSGNTLLKVTKPAGSRGGASTSSRDCRGKGWSSGIQCCRLKEGRNLLVPLGSVLALCLSLCSVSANKVGLFSNTQLSH